MCMTNEPRKAVEVPVRVFGTDCDGKPFYENLITVDVSLHEAKLGGLKAKLQLDEIIGLTYGKNKGHFRVKWVGTPGTATEGVLRRLNLNPAKPLWDFPVSDLQPEAADVQPTRERRRWPRVKCSVSVELRAKGEPVIWGKASDLSQGGCFIEMAIPLHNGIIFDIALWLGRSQVALARAGGERAARLRKRRSLSKSYFRTPGAPAPVPRTLSPRSRRKYRLLKVSGFGGSRASANRQRPRAGLDTGILVAVHPRRTAVGGHIKSQLQPTPDT
jgi:hypothetical protein